MTILQLLVTVADGSPYGAFHCALLRSSNHMFLLCSCVCDTGPRRFYQLSLQEGWGGERLEGNWNMCENPYSRYYQPPPYVDFTNIFITRLFYGLICLLLAS